MMLANKSSIKEDPDWRIEIQPHGTVTNGLVTLKLSGLHTTFERYIRYIGFQLDYKKQDDEWKYQTFFGRRTSWSPVRHLNIRVDTDLYDYDMQFSLSMFIPNFLHGYIPENIGGKVVPRETWFAHSHTVTVNVPSLMREPQVLQLHDWVKFRTSELRDNTWTPGELLAINNHENTIYTVSDISAANLDYKVNAEDIKARNVYYYVDLSERKRADNLFLIGTRQNDNDQIPVIDLYELLLNIFETKYTDNSLEDICWDAIDLESAYKCVAFNVIDFLSVNEDKGYKVQCVFDTEHDDKTLKLIQDREYAVRRALNLHKPDSAQGIVYFCDVCRCEEGEYGFMFRCKRLKDCQYDGHDICCSCVYEMIKRYNQLHGLLLELLKQHLNHDCIHDIVAFVAGHVVKL